MKLKFLLILIFVFIYSTHISAQLSIDAGPDKTFCINLPPLDTGMRLGDKVVINNPIDPIKVVWECNIDVGITRIFHASDILNDTTILNPTIIGITEVPVKFFLHIWDGLGNYALDSITVSFSEFVFLSIEWHYNINKGDSIKFLGEVNIDGGIPPLSIVLTPSYGLTDSTDLATWAKPDSNIMYYQVATDAAGCISQPVLVYVIDILPNSIKDEEHELTIWQNDSEISISENKEGLKQLNVYTINGTLIYSEESTKNRFNVGSKIQNAGIYICSIAIDNKIYLLKFIKN